MSFADELRKPCANEKNYSGEERIVKDCLNAIRKKCWESKRSGKNYIRGGYYYNASDYGDYAIVDREGTVFNYRNTSWDYIRNRLIQEIKSLGFTQYNVTIKDVIVKEQRGFTFFGNPRIVATGEIGHSIYVEIRW